MAEDGQKKTLDDLVKLAGGGDTAAFALIYDELVKPVYRYIFYRVEKEIAEDLTEETFLRVWQNLKSYTEKKRSFSAWVFRIAHNLVVDHYRKNHVSEELDETAADPDPNNNPANCADMKLTHVRLKKVIRQLPENYRQVIILKYINELNNSEIAGVMNKSEAAVRTIQFRALSKLRSMLSDDRGFL